jgi:hypothetical protein
MYTLLSNFQISENLPLLSIGVHKNSCNFDDAACNSLDGIEGYSFYID